MKNLTDFQNKTTQFIRDDFKLSIRKELRICKEHENMIHLSKHMLQELNKDDKYNDSDIIRMFINVGFGELNSIYENSKKDINHG